MNIYLGRTRYRSILQGAGCVMLLIHLAACATTDSESVDPLEKYNRSMFAVNRFGDEVIYKPFGKAYKAIIPSFARKGVHNFFDNLTTPRSAANNFLQGKPARGVNELLRFMFNSTLGVAGLFDIAAAGGMDRYEEDFSQTLAVWGMPEGPYMVIPIWGPRSMLATAALPVDFFSDLQRSIEDTGTRNRLYVLRLIDTRSRLLTTEEMLNKSQDPYIAFREAYLQNRQFNIHDGEIPDDEEIYFFDDQE
ncbi:MAG: VacJ family lipoprotein [Gammaproteobacteria bacterium]|nr:VacJ family lipoprotein [Gammaproteobacteria bacterium]MDH5302954.1 VacJ family lipoprotein [Gammaproteobacteria bacterium]MDH5321132.1 VacJ family lipoprotein [Gammaproteobacteria bacterium]